MQLQPTQAIPRSVRAEFDAKPYGGIGLKSATILRLRAYIKAPILSPDSVDDVHFRIAIQFSSGVNLRGAIRKLSQTTMYDELIDVTNQPAGTTIEQIRLKATNYALERPALAIFIAQVQLEKFLE